MNKIIVHTRPIATKTEFDTEETVQKAKSELLDEIESSTSLNGFVEDIFMHIHQPSIENSRRRRSTEKHVKVSFTVTYLQEDEFTEVSQNIVETAVANSISEKYEHILSESPVVLSIFEKVKIPEKLQSEISPCASTRCWFWDQANQRCRFRANQNCASLTCHSDRITFDFKEELFGIGPDVDPKNVVNGNCDPVWKEGQWKWEGALGQCDMKFANKIISSSQEAEPQDQCCKS